MLVLDDFRGAKIALLFNDHVLTYQRDDFPHIPFPGMWDLPGGGREGGESPQECALRELHEEFSIHLSVDRIIWGRCYPNFFLLPMSSYFFVGTLDDNDVRQIQFGSEGQCWAFVPTSAFIDKPNAIPHLRGRLSEYLSQNQKV